MTTVTKSKSTLYFTIASALYIFIAIGHTAGFVLNMNKDQGLIGAAVYEGMAHFQPMEGRSAHSLLDFYYGDSYYAALGCLALGVWGIMIARYFKNQSQSVPRSFSAVGAIFSVAGLALGVLYFPVPPIVILSLSSLFFVLAMI